MQSKCSITLVSAVHMTKCEDSTVEPEMDTWLLEAGVGVSVLIFVDPRLLERVMAARLQHDAALARTCLVAAPLSAQPACVVAETRASATRGCKLSGTDDPSDVASMLKFGFLQQAAILDPFHTTHLAWVDWALGCTRTRPLSPCDLATTMLAERERVRMDSSSGVVDGTSAIVSGPMLELARVAASVEAEWLSARKTRIQTRCSEALSRVMHRHPERFVVCSVGAATVAPAPERPRSQGTLYVRTVGGLGNHLFTMAAALAHALRTGQRCVFRRAWADADGNGAPRPTHWHTLFAALPQVADFPPCKRVHTDWAPGYRPLPDWGAADTLLMEGHYLSPKYAQSSLARFAHLLFPPDIVRYARGLVPNGLRSWAFVHVRRGDFCKLREMYNVLSMDYYARAMAEYPRCTAFLVFCERAEHARLEQDVTRTIGASGERFSWRMADPAVPDHLQLLLMSVAPAGGVLANSSFSAWAAFRRALDAGRPLFVAPRRFYADPSFQAQEDECDPAWTRI